MKDDRNPENRLISELLLAFMAISVLFMFLLQGGN